MFDLFDTPVLPGLSTRADIIDAAEERILIDRIDASDLMPFRFPSRLTKVAIFANPNPILRSLAAATLQAMTSST